MAAITKIEFWSDVGFVDGAVEIPRLNAPDPINPTVTIEEEILPSKDRFFSELKLKEYYTGLLTMSYMRITYDLKNSLGIETPNVFYGWVDSVKLSSDGELPMTIISWHIDEWRTWKSAVTFGSGHIKRRPFRDLATTPIQNYQKIYRKFGSSVTDLFTIVTDAGERVRYVVFSYNVIETVNNVDVITKTLVGFFPTSKAGCSLARDSGGTDPSISMFPSEVDKGYLSDIFGIRPSQINGIWLTDIPPLKLNYNGRFYETSGDWTYVRKADSGGTYYGYFEGYLRPYNYDYETTFTDPITADEEHQYSIVDMEGNICYSLPYGMTVNKVESNLIVTPTTCCQIFIFDFDGIYERRNSSLGLVALIPCPVIPVLSNAWSEYNYSGERQYDIDMRTLQTETGAVKQIAAGVGTGSMMGAFGPGGLLIGGIGGAVGGTTNYLVETLWQNDKEQEILDRLKANQSPNVLMSGNSCADLIGHGTRIALYEFVPDDYSDQQIIATRNQFGISVDELMSSCDSLIRTTSPTGYYNIQNMIVNGNVPVSAKKWIREKFRSGVRLI